MPTMQTLKVNYLIYLYLINIYGLCNVYVFGNQAKKLQATAVLVSFIAANTIHLAIGTRNPFILSILFAFVYYFMREQTEKGKGLDLKKS